MIIGIFHPVLPLIITDDVIGAGLGTGSAGISNNTEADSQPILLSLEAKQEP